MLTVKSKALIVKIVLLGAFFLFLDAPQGVEVAAEFTEKEQVTKSQPNLHDTPQGMGNEEVTTSQSLHDAIFESCGIIPTPSDAKITPPQWIGSLDFRYKYVQNMEFGWGEFFRRLTIAALLYQKAHCYLDHFSATSSAKLQEHLETMMRMKKSTVEDKKSIVEDFTLNYLKNLQKDTHWWYKLSPSAQAVFERDLKIQWEKIMPDPKEPTSEAFEMISQWGKTPGKYFSTDPLKDCTQFSQDLFGKFSYWYILEAFNKHIAECNKPSIADHIKSLYSRVFTTYETIGRPMKTLAHIGSEDIREVSHKIFFHFRTILTQEDPKHAEALYSCNRCTNPFQCECGWLFGSCNRRMHLKGYFMMSLVSLKKEYAKPIEDVLKEMRENRPGSIEKFDFKIFSQESALEFLRSLYWNGYRFQAGKDRVAF